MTHLNCSKTKPHSVHQSGNALFFVLIGVALFAALAQAVVNTGRINENSVAQEKAGIIAGQVVRFAAQVEKGVERVRLLNGCKDTEIDFHNEVYLETDGTTPAMALNHNPNAPTDGSCSVFHSNGGQVIPLLFENLGIENQTTGAWITGHGGVVIADVEYVGTTGGSGRGNDLLWTFPKIRLEVCQEIHRRLELSTNLQDDAAAWHVYDGVYDGVGLLGDNWTEIAGQRTFCRLNTSDANSAFFYHVLIAR